MCLIQLTWRSARWLPPAKPTGRRGATRLPLAEPAGIGSCHIYPCTITHCIVKVSILRVAGRMPCQACSGQRC